MNVVKILKGKTMKIYVVMKNTLIVNNEEDVVFTDVVGVFTSPEKLNEIAKELVDTDDYFYEMKIMDLNKLVDEDPFNEGLELLFKAGQLDLLVGEDGEFYFIPAAKGPAKE